tara:strand:- start:202 stop:366 length:165 start_codon:yes stop_codon:yes gene_type:complete
MFKKEELALLHKAVSELVIKGSDAAQVASLLSKIVTVHEKESKKVNPPSKISGK